LKLDLNGVVPEEKGTFEKAQGVGFRVKKESLKGEEFSKRGGLQHGFWATPGENLGRFRGPYKKPGTGKRGHQGGPEDTRTRGKGTQLGAHNL